MRYNNHLWGALVSALLLLAAAAGPSCVDPYSKEDAGEPVMDLGNLDVSLNELKSLRIKPADAVLYNTETKAAQQPYTALGTFADGKERDITPKTSFEVLSTRVGFFNDHVFNASIGWGGKTTVQARTTTGVVGTTSLTVVLQRRYTAKGVAPADVTALEQTPAKDTGPTPSLVYPPDGALIPTNINELEFQWLPGSGQQTFEISLRNDGTDIRIYTTCAVKIGAGCGYTPDAKQWKAIVTALKGDDAVTVKVRGKDASSALIGGSNGRKLQVAEEDIQGGLYYWNATPGAIVRYDFGTPNQKAKLFYTAPEAKALFCVGCHAMSLDGSRMAVGLDMPAPAPLRVIDVASKKLLSSGAANFMGFSPDGKLLITSDGNSLVARVSATLAPLAPNPLRAKGSMPDWAPEGTRVVYAEPATVIPFPVGTPGISKGSLKVLNFDPKTGKFSSTSRTLVASAGENNYYPTFSPDGKWVVFNRSSGSSYDAKDATLWIVRADGKSKPIELKLANGGSNLTNSWPKFSPFLQKYRGGKLMWFTFSSRRDYGLRLKGKAQAQLWMAAVDPSKGELSTDPSFTAFWLPFQNIKTGNHIAQWTKKVIRKKCGPDSGCPKDQVCVKGWCEPK